MVQVGDKLKVTAGVYDDGEDHHPPGYIALPGDVVFVRDISHGGKGGERIYVSHEGVTDKMFLIYRHEFVAEKG